MLRTIAFVALVLAGSAIGNSSFAEPSGFEGPPPWRDSASVYLNGGANSAGTSTSTKPPIESSAQGPAADLRYAAGPQPTTPPQLTPTPPPPYVDPAVQQAFHQGDVDPVANDGQRRLAPPTSGATRPAGRDTDAMVTGSPDLGLPLESMTTTLAALAVVIGCILICTWLVRRGTRKTTAALPREVVSVLGRVPLAARNVAQLLRVGNKLVLVSITPAGAETLTEVTEPAEVDRLVGLCQQSDPHSTTKAFEQVLQQMSFDPMPGGFLGKESAFGSTGRGGALRA